MKYDTMKYEKGRTDGFRYARGRHKEIKTQRNRCRSYDKGFEQGMADAERAPDRGNKARHKPTLGVIVKQSHDPVTVALPDYEGGDDRW